LKIPNTKRAGGVAKGVGPEFKPQYRKKKKKKVAEPKSSPQELTTNVWWRTSHIYRGWEDKSLFF
jgi:hypothetical protein